MPYPFLRGQPLKVQKSFCPVNRKAMDREKVFIHFFPCICMTGSMKYKIEEEARAAYFITFRLGKKRFVFCKCE